jgi:signal transduction histidine kinase/ActR/RegA family two-component response regulator/HPt (histidine-containing phosphotransfer) domain-containing protein
VAHCDAAPVSSEESSSRSGPLTRDIPRFCAALARVLGDWLPVGGILVCVALDALPHGRIDGVDAILLATGAAALFSIARQRLLIVRERDATRRLVGEERLRAEKDAAESANRAKSAFLATMSHEIRTPLNAILGNATLLGDAALGPAERESVDAIESAGVTLLTVINAVLDFSKIEAERMELERVGFAPATLIGSVVSLFGIAARDRGLTLTADIETSIPVILAGDPHRLHQILSNLVGNAIKFTEHGGVTVRARVVERTPDETLLRFEVADTGIGIDEEARTRLFAPFVQVDASTTRRFGGSGLGLAICRSLIGLMGGEIDVDSTLGSGSTFWFTVRLGTPTDLEAGAVLEANEYVDRTVDTIGARVLVAEDNPANSRLIERLLGRLGIDTVLVGNGREALDAVREGAETYDLVLMDCHMPEMDGLDATRAIRAEGFDIPIVALTANAMGSDRTACFAAGMNDYLSKPVKSADLAAAMHRWLPGDVEMGSMQRPPGVGAEAGAAMAHVAGLIDQGQMAELFALDPDGSAGFLAAMVDSYRATAAETWPQIRAAVSDCNWTELEEAAHKLKGVAANLGVRRVHECAARLVALVRSEEVAGVAGIRAASETASELDAALGPADAALATLLAETCAAAGLDGEPEASLGESPEARFDARSAA